MHQIPFDFNPADSPSFANFLAQGNEQAVRHLTAGSFARGSSTLIWGASGCGKTHLLAALGTSRVRTAFISGRPSIGKSEPLPSPQPQAVLVIDDTQKLSDEGQAWLFNAYNSFYTPGQEWYHAIVVSCSSMPRDAGIREDLATRMASGLVFLLNTLADEQKHVALQQHAQEKGFALNNEVTAFLLTHHRRDMPALMRLLNRLDHYSRANKRAITVPMVKEVIAIDKTDTQ
jgi:DnaA-homolog protein